PLAPSALSDPSPIALYPLSLHDALPICPNARYATKVDFKPGLEGFAALTKWAKVVDLLVDGDRAALLYDCELPAPVGVLRIASLDRKSTRLNSSHEWISYAVFCLKKKKC